MVIRKFDGELLLGSVSKEYGPGVAQIGDEALVALQENGDCAGAGTGVVDAAAFEFFLSVFEHFGEVVFDVLFRLELAEVALVRTFLQLGGDVVVGGLAGLASGGTVAVVDCEEVGVVAQILEHAAGVLALLLLGARTHQAGHVHFDSFEGVGLLLVLVPLVLLFLLLGLACPEDAQKVHRNLNIMRRRL